MDVYTHTLLAVGCIAVAFYAGRYFAKMSVLEEIVNDVLSKLERGGFIHTKKDKDGEKVLVRITELIKKYKQTT